MSTPDYRTILVDVADRVAVVTLNRPDQMNAFDGQMGREMGNALTWMEASEEIRAIVVTGAGRAFCAGAALDSDVSTFKPGQTEVVFGPPVSDMSPWEMSTPILAAINGAAAGVGLTLTMQWDIRVAAAEAKMAFPFTRRGLLPEANSLWLLSRAVGSARAIELLITGRTFTGADAASMGIVHQAVPADQVLDTTMSIARDIATNTAPASVGAAKRMFYQQLASVEREEARAAERAMILWLASQPDAKEGVSAFLARRKPEWSMSKHAVPVEDEGGAR